MDDPRELLVCARYEFRRGEPIEKAYENFCEIVGNDAMAYRDFEFWWYRFKEGNFDLDYDRIKNPSKELGDIPIDIIEEIFEKLECKERAICRKVSRNVRHLIDNMKFAIKYITISSSDDSIILIFNYKFFIKYVKTDNGCRVVWDGKSKIINGADFRHTMYADLKAMLNNPKLQITFLTVAMEEIGENRDTAMSIFSAFLSSIGHHLNVKCFRFYAKNQEEVLTILPWLKPRVLEHIQLLYHHFGMADRYHRSPHLRTEPPKLKIDKIVELDQWKKAIRSRCQLTILDFKIEHFLHFNDIRAHIDAISKEDAIRLKNTILASPHFEFCSLKVESNQTYEDVIEIFGVEKLSIPGSTSFIEVRYNHGHNTVSLAKNSYIFLFYC